jgi:hypothetical protein
MIDHIVVINDLSVPKGGATALALASASAFRARGYRVTFVTGDDGDNPALRDQVSRSSHWEASGCCRAAR